MNQEDEVCAEGTTTHIVVRKEDFKPFNLKRYFQNGFRSMRKLRSNSSSQLKGAVTLTAPDFFIVNMLEASRYAVLMKFEFSKHIRCWMIVCLFS